jgi:hypothetical protein
VLPRNPWRWLTVELKSDINLAANLDVDNRLWHRALFEAWRNVSVLDLDSLSGLDTLGQALLVLGLDSEHPFGSSLETSDSTAEDLSAEALVRLPTVKAGHNRLDLVALDWSTAIVSWLSPSNGDAAVGDIGNLNLFWAAGLLADSDEVLELNWLTNTVLVLAENSEEVSVTLVEVGSSEGHSVDNGKSGPGLSARFSLLHVVVLNVGATVVLRSVPAKTARLLGDAGDSEVLAWAWSVRHSDRESNSRVSTAVASVDNVLAGIVSVDALEHEFGEVLVGVDVASLLESLWHSAILGPFDHWVWSAAVFHLHHKVTAGLDGNVSVESLL